MPFLVAAAMLSNSLRASVKSASICFRFSVGDIALRESASPTFLVRQARVEEVAFDVFTVA
jgi:hypothetical protein